jgi:hypothetical protein
MHRIDHVVIGVSWGSSGSPEDHSQEAAGQNYKKNENE